MSKITREHLKREAYVYVRQSSAMQVRENKESQRVQYKLKERAQSLGWKKVTVIDEDLGHSADGALERKGFERLLSSVCTGNVGAIFSVDASRLARNGREWHTLLEFCGIVEVLIIDQEGMYDPRLPNDRLLLGMKGTMSEMELGMFRQRSQQALREKAKRGELHVNVPIGYMKTDANRVIKDPDYRVQQGISLVFEKFCELGSARQVLIWCRQEQVELPAIRYSRGRREIVWKLPLQKTVLRILTNPIYAGAYAWGRTKVNTRIKDGRKSKHRIVRRDSAQWDVLLPDHHEGYITWVEFETNQQMLANNTKVGDGMRTGVARSGEALLAGLLRCGHCGRKLRTQYGSRRGRNPRYVCRGGNLNNGTGGCIAFGGVRLDQAVSEKFLKAISPIGLEAACSAIEEIEREKRDVRRQRELALEQARYEALLAQRQYDAIDPDNRLVASELERRWNDALEKVVKLEEEIEKLSEIAKSLSPEEQKSILALADDLPTVWQAPQSDPALKKRLLRIAMREIVVYVESAKIRALIHWHGGDHTEIEVLRNKRGEHRWVLNKDTVELLREVARVLPDKGIAGLFNRIGHRTAKGLTWTASRVAATRNRHNIDAYSDNERTLRGEITLQEAANILGVSHMKVLRMIRLNIIPARQACRYAPWVIKRSVLNSEPIQQAARSVIRPRTDSRQQVDLAFSTT